MSGGDLDGGGILLPEEDAARGAVNGDGGSCCLKVEVIARALICLFCSRPDVARSNQGIAGVLPSVAVVQVEAGLHCLLCLGVLGEQGIDRAVVGPGHCFLLLAFFSFFLL